MSQTTREALRQRTDEARTRLVNEVLQNIMRAADEAINLGEYSVPIDHLLENVIPEIRDAVLQRLTDAENAMSVETTITLRWGP